MDESFFVQTYCNIIIIIIFTHSEYIIALHVDLTGCVLINIYLRCGLPYPVYEN